MRIIALDPSYTCTGYAIIKDARPVEWGIVPLGTRKASRAERRAELLTWIVYQIKAINLPVDMLVTEQLWVPAGISINTGIIDAGYACNVPVRAVNTHQWKKAVLGHANGSKDDALRVARIVTGCDIGSDNVADAICIGLAARYPQLLRKPE